MRKLLVLLCSLTALAAAPRLRWAQPTPGTLSVERGRGVVMIDLKGSVLGRHHERLPARDRSHAERPLRGRRERPEAHAGAARAAHGRLPRGQGLRFRMLGGGYRMVARGSGITVSAVGRGVVMLDAEPRFTGDDAGVYSLDGTDCSVEPLSCTPLPLEPERFTLEPPVEPPQPKAAS